MLVRLSSLCPNAILQREYSPENYFTFVFSSFFLLFFNPLNPKSNQNLISPYNITPESQMKVLRIKLMVTREGTFWLANKSSLSAP